MKFRTKIGILALQGNFQQHFDVIEKIGADPVFIRDSIDFTHDIRGLILPGGESTTMTKLLKADKKLWEKIMEFGKSGNPILGTCAGLILLSKNIVPNDNLVETMGFLNISVERNAYGPQIYSKFNDIETTSGHHFSVVFIRAPSIVNIEKEKGVEILAEFENRPCAVKQENFFGLTFHPELTKVTYFHELAFDNILNK